MTISAESYVGAARAVLDQVAREQLGAVRRAADLILTALGRDGIVQAFGSGHSQTLAMEIAGRAGGLVPTNMLALRDVVVLGGEPPEVLHDPMLERDPDVARRIFALAGPRPEDVFVIASNSGVNGSVVELATLATTRGHPLIAITSLAHTRQVESRHESGRRLCDLADVVLDNGAPYGDALLPLPGGGAACAISSITGALLAQMVIAEVVGRLVETGERPPVYLSNNVPGGLDHNDALEARYTGRIHRTA
jgi:uncharacterized phosphosugar-binding protein